MSPQEIYMNVSDVPFYFEVHRIILEPFLLFPPVSSHLPLLTAVLESDAPLESYSGRSRLALQFSHLLPILAALTFLSACNCVLPKSMLLWYLMLTKLL